MKTKAEIAQNLTERRLRETLSALHGHALEAWIRDTLCGASNMGNHLTWTRNDANALRAKADEMEARAISRLVDDITAAWKPEEIYQACDKATK